MARVTMSAEEIKERIAGRKDLGEVDLRAVERFLARKAYRDEYNKRPEVKARRKEYQAKRLEEDKRARALVAELEKRAGASKK